MSTVIDLALADPENAYYYTSVDERRHVSEEYVKAKAEGRLMKIRQARFEALPDDESGRSPGRVHAGSPRIVQAVEEVEVNTAWVLCVRDDLTTSQVEATRAWREANPCV